MRNLTIPLIAVFVRRDAFTITPTTVPPYEVTLLRTLFGKENVVEEGEAGTRDLDAGGEHERLSNKYGVDKVIRVFGDDEGARLLELVEKAAVKKGKAAEGDGAGDSVAKASGRGGKGKAAEGGESTDQTGA